MAAGLLDFLFGGGQQGAGLLGYPGQQPLAPDVGSYAFGQNQPMSLTPADLAFAQAPQQSAGPFGMLPQAPQQQAPALPPQMPGLNSNMFAQMALPPQQQSIFGGHPINAIRGALNQIADPMQQRQQQAFQNYIALRGLEQPKFDTISTDIFGNPVKGFVNPNTMTITPATTAANPNAQPGQAAADTSGVASFLAPGVKNYDPTLTGEAYLKQFSPDVQAAIQGRVNGLATPSSNPRKGFTQAVDLFSRKYGADIGIPMDDNAIQERRKMMTGLAQTTPGSIGGQVNFAGTSLTHLADTAEKIVALDNSGGLGVAPLAKLINNLRQLTTDQAGKANAVQGAAQHYGQEVTKFYAGSPGGEGERMRFLNSLSTAKSPTELADALQTERDLIPGRLDMLRGQIISTLGENTPAGQRALARLDEAQKSIPRIEAAIAKLRGQTPADVAAPAEPAATPSAAAPASSMPLRVNSQSQYNALPSGSQYIAPDGSLRTKR